MNLYGWSKHLFDLAVIDRFATGAKLPPQWAGLKFFNVFGPNEYHKGEMASLIARRFDEASAGKAVRRGSARQVGSPFQAPPRRRRRRRPETGFHLCRRRGRGAALASRHALGI